MHFSVHIILNCVCMLYTLKVTHHPLMLYFVHSKSPIAHTNPLFKKMNNLRVSDLYTCNLLKMYYKLYRNMLPVYFESFIPEYGDYRHNLRNDQIRLPLIRCEYGEMNVKYQMHLRLRELSTPSNPPKYPSIAINDDTLSKSYSAFSRYVKDEFLSSYNSVCTTPGCYSCEGWLLIKIALVCILCSLLLLILCEDVPLSFA